MRASICLGTYSLTNFARLNLAYLRRVFGDIPICVYDGRSENSSLIEEISKDYGCVYIGEETNRGHFSGDLMTAVTSIAFAQANSCEIAIKLNQRTVILSKEIPEAIEQAFSDPAIILATPGRYPEASILDDKSKFHAKFPQAVDILAFRASVWDAQGVADRYHKQWTTGTGKYDTYSEVFWANEVKRLPGVTKEIPELTSHNGPFKYLRKIQNRPEDYSRAALEVGLPEGEFPTVEWDKLKAGYMPLPRA